MHRSLFRALLKILPLAFLALLAASCSRDEPVLGPGADGAAQKAALDTSGWCDPSSHERMKGYLADNEGVELRPFSTKIEWAVGGVLDATPAEWPDGYEIKMIFPPFSVSPEYRGYESVEFTVAVPAAGPGPGISSVPIEFLPDGIFFDKPPRLIFSWPPWAGTPTQEVLTLAMIETEMHDGQMHYRMTDAFDSQSAAFTASAGVEPLAGWTETELSTGFEFSLPHFCQWEVIDDDEADDTVNSNSVPDPSGTSGSCWSPLVEEEEEIADSVG